ncbi:hypothetical protein SSX86_022864 [Deinandra increscens subsp. villosa]|uniref:DHHA2 domain-containing protein n=1 Tax=Deinandra increscens subsp. villosa TaxID=3103831 RepID=A0AAP0CJN7_9ASTR
MADSILQELTLIKQGGKYIRARENPFFDGLKRGNSNTTINSSSRKSLFDYVGRTSKQKITRCSSSSSVIIGHTTDIPSHASSSQLSLPQSVGLTSPQIVDDHIQSDRNVFNTKKQEVSLPPCAASFYHGTSPHVDAVVSCLSIHKLNMYLKASKDAVNAGVPGRFLRAVLGHVSDAGSFISVIMYSFYLNETDKTSQFCTVPVINLKRSYINSHAELEWLLRCCNIDKRSLLFIDEVDLSYYALFGSLKIVLLNADKLHEKQEALKDSVVEVFKKGGFAYPSDDTAVVNKDCSCCALIAEKFASISPGLLAGKGFSRLLLAGILLDTENLTSPECTSVDRYMSTLLLNGAGRFGCNGLYHILRSKMHDVSQLGVGQILHKDFRKWSTTGKTDIGGSRLAVGMSSVGISISQLLHHNETSIQEIVLFQQLEKLGLLMIITSYNHYKNFKDLSGWLVLYNLDIKYIIKSLTYFNHFFLYFNTCKGMLIVAESEDLMEDFLRFLDTHASHLSLHALYQPGLGDEMRAFTSDSFLSRTTMEQLLQDFSTTY